MDKFCAMFCGGPRAWFQKSLFILKTGLLFTSAIGIWRLNGVARRSRAAFSCILKEFCSHFATRFSCSTFRLFSRAWSSVVKIFAVPMTPWELQAAGRRLSGFCCFGAGVLSSSSDGIGFVSLDD